MRTLTHDPAVEQGTDSPTRPPRPRPTALGRARRRRRFRTAVVVVALLMAPVVWSYSSYLTAPGDAPVSVRSVDWLRDHGFESAVNGVEQWWYTRNAPTGTRPPTGDIPKVLRGAPAAALGVAVPPAAERVGRGRARGAARGLASRPGGGR